MMLPKIMVAPNGASLQKDDHAAVPITIDEIVETARQVKAAGADGLHAHTRDASGTHVLDVGLARELIAEMTLAMPGFYLQITTEAVGRFEPHHQAALIRDAQPAAVSVAMREVMREAKIAFRVYREAQEAGIHIQHILYSVGEIAQFAALIEAGVITPDAAVLLVLGRYDGVSRPEPSDLAPILAARPMHLPYVDWAVSSFGPSETRVLNTVRRKGGKVRIGFENNIRNRDGRIAKDNADRVFDLENAWASLCSS